MLLNARQPELGRLLWLVRRGRKGETRDSCYLKRVPVAQESLESTVALKAKAFGSLVSFSTYTA